MTLDASCARFLESCFEVRSLVDRFVLEKPKPAVSTGSRVDHRLPFVGRDRELAMLEDYFENAATEHRAGVVLVTAPAGAGKTRLREELYRRVRARSESVEVWFATADSMSAGSALAMFSLAVRRACSVVDGEANEVSREKFFDYVGRYLRGAENARFGAPEARRGTSLEFAPSA